MKPLAYVFSLLLLISACDTESQKFNNVKNTDTNKIITKKDTVLPGDNDTINISTVVFDKIKFTKGQLRKIRKTQPEFSEELIKAPDITLAEQRGDDFNCEACEDSYYELYAYFLKLKDGGNKYQKQRETLVKYTGISFTFMEALQVSVLVINIIAHWEMLNIPFICILKIKIIAKPTVSLNKNRYTSAC